jgi:acyl-CoA reductase-like NAD-dependent aldehyde dehydrogenase
VVHTFTTDDIDHAVDSATWAQEVWKSTTFKERRKVLRTLLKLELPFHIFKEMWADFDRYILENQDVIARVACLDSGKTRIDASFGEILVTAEKLKWTIDHGEKALRPQQRPTNLLMIYKNNTVVYEPLGVVSACVSWK